MKIKFSGCKYLDFDRESFGSNVNRNFIQNHVCWNRKETNRLVQFCRLRGILKSPTACIEEKDKMCPEYEEHLFELDISQDEAEL